MAPETREGYSSATWGVTAQREKTGDEAPPPSRTLPRPIARTPGLVLIALLLGGCGLNSSFDCRYRVNLERQKYHPVAVGGLVGAALSPQPKSEPEPDYDRMVSDCMAPRS